MHGDAPPIFRCLQALVDELELKLDQDERLVKEVCARFREECCEKQACQTDFSSMKRAIQERAALQKEMINTRYKQHETLQKGNAINAERLSQVGVGGYVSISEGVGFVVTDCPTM